MPRVEDVADGRGVLVKVLKVGLDGTDREINAGEYGTAPTGDEFLILGHESLCGAVSLAITQCQDHHIFCSATDAGGSQLSVDLPTHRC